MLTPQMTVRIERFRETLKLWRKYADRDFTSISRDFYLHIHETKLSIGLCTELSNKVGYKNTLDHFYRPQPFFPVFMEKPELIDSFMFKDIYLELCKVVRVARVENNALRGKFSNMLSERIYRDAIIPTGPIRLFKRDGNRNWINSTPLNSQLLEVPEFMRSLEVEVLGRS